MLTGTYMHSLDAKNRLVIPAKLKEQLGDTVTILRGSGSDRCLKVYSAAEWKKYADKISELPPTQIRALTRYLYSTAMEVQPDSQGRIMLQPDMLKFAGIERNIVTLGVGTYAEIWAQEIYESERVYDPPKDVTETLIEFGL